MYCTKLLRTALAQVSASSATASTSAAPLVPALPVQSPYVHLPLTLWPRRRRQQPETRTSLQDEAENTTPDSKSVPEVDPDVYTSIVSLPSDVFHVPHRPDVLHQCVVAHLASLRQGTARTKNRAEVRGSNRKLHRQKGTGRARVGDAASPTRRGGGRAFPKRQRDFSKDLNDKVWKLGLRSALSERWRRGDVRVFTLCYHLAPLALPLTYLATHRRRSLSSPNTRHSANHPQRNSSTCFLKCPMH